MNINYSMHFIFANTGSVFTQCFYIISYILLLAAMIKKRGSNTYPGMCVCVCMCVFLYKCSDSIERRLIMAAFLKCLVESTFSVYTFYVAFINPTFKVDLERQMIIVKFSHTKIAVSSPYILFSTSMTVRKMLAFDYLRIK